MSAPTCISPDTCASLDTDTYALLEDIPRLRWPTELRHYTLAPDGVFLHTANGRRPITQGRLLVGQIVPCPVPGHERIELVWDRQGWRRVVLPREQVFSDQLLELLRLGLPVLPSQLGDVHRYLAAFEQGRLRRHALGLDHLEAA